MYCTAVLTLENILWEKYELDPQTWLVVCAHFYSITAVVLDFDLHPHEWFTIYAFSSARMASDRIIWRRALAPFGVSENTSARQIPLSNTQMIVCVCVCAQGFWTLCWATLIMLYLTYIHIQAILKTFLLAEHTETAFPIYYF